MDDKYHVLKVMMYDLGITQEALAEKLGTSKQTVNAKLNGKREFTVQEAKIIADYLGIEKPEEIFFNR